MTSDSSDSAGGDGVGVVICDGSVGLHKINKYKQIYLKMEKTDWCPYLNFRKMTILRRDGFIL